MPGKDEQEDVTVVVTEDSSLDKKDQSDDVIVDDDPETPDDDKVDKDKKNEPKPEDGETPENPPADKDEKKVETENEKVLKEERDVLLKKKRDLEIALHKERQAKKAAKKDDEFPLTRQQLKQILDENPGDTETQMRVMEYMMNKAATEKKDEALSEVHTGNTKREMEDFLLNKYPALADETSEMRLEVEQTKSKYGIADHPFGDYFAVGTRVMESLPDIIQQAYEKGKADAVSKKADDKRREKISESDLTPPGKKKGDSSGVLTKDQLATAKQLGLKGNALKHYAAIVGKSTRSVSVED